MRNSRTESRLQIYEPVEPAKHKDSDERGLD